jgi:hypothetical protein
VPEACVPSAGSLRGRRIDAVEVHEDCICRGVEAVEVHAVEIDHAARRRASCARLVVSAEPARELDHLLVAPHPGGKAAERGERGVGVGVAGSALHPPIQSTHVGPVGFDGDGVETLLLEQPLRDARALVVELVAAVRRLAEEHEARVADPIEERVVVVALAGERNDGGEELALGRRGEAHHISHFPSSAIR